MTKLLAVSNELYESINIQGNTWTDMEILIQKKKLKNVNQIMQLPSKSE